MQKSKKGYVYMLTNHWENVLYIGSTEDLKTRIIQHKQGLIAGFTQKYKVKKNEIVESINPQWIDLSSNVS